MPPSAEEFARWRDDSVTRWVLWAVEKGAEDNRQAWIDASWGNGAASPQHLAELRTRADAYLALRDTSYEGWAEIHGEEPLYD